MLRSGQISCPYETILPKNRSFCHTLLIQLLCRCIPRNRVRPNRLISIPFSNSFTYFSQNAHILHTFCSQTCFNINTVRWNKHLTANKTFLFITGLQPCCSPPPAKSAAFGPPPWSSQKRAFVRPECFPQKAENIPVFYWAEICQGVFLQSSVPFVLTSSKKNATIMPLSITALLFRCRG